MDYRPKFCVELKSVVNSICRQMVQQPFQEDAKNLSSMQVWVIHYLYENQDEDVFQRDLETGFNIRRSTVSGILQNMERKGYIHRQSVDYDARLKKITLTDDAITIYNEVLQRVFWMEVKMTAGITDEEWVVFYQVLEKIKRNLS
ncbi:MAG: MarR family transcriptional regulator [Clostridia bacterium]|nr:MarR family transcriptional regulator [Anaerotignum sp.]NCC17045.1 MarR family transcriptional regulator [Clostridia bacterium]